MSLGRNGIREGGKEDRSFKAEKRQQLLPERLHLSFRF